MAAMPRTPWACLAILFAVIPLAAGLIFRTYKYEVDPLCFEAVRQLDLLFLVIEVAVIAYARKRGFAYVAIFRELPKDVRWVLILFLATFWVGSVFVTNFTTYSMLRAMLWPAHILFGAALWHLGGRSDAAAVRRIVLILLIGYFAYFPLLAAHFLRAPDPATLRLGSVVWTSALPGYLSVRHFGIEMGVLLAMLLGLVWRDPSFGGAPVPGYTAITLVGGAVCWSGTRAAIFGLAGAILITLALRRNVPRAATVVLTCMALLVGGSVSMLILPPDPSFGLFRIVPNPGDYSSGRIQIWIDAFNLFLARPLTGWGEGSLIWLVSWNGISFAHPHNMPIQMLESWGAPAAIAAFYLIGRLWFAMQHRTTQNAWLLPVAMAFDTLLIMSMVDGVFFHARIIMLVALMNAVALTSCHSGSSTTTGLQTKKRRLRHQV